MSPNLPNTLTWTRIAIIPVIVGVYYLPEHWPGTQYANLIATIFFIIAAITDWLDGWAARKLGQTSAFGAFLDPVADKLLVSAALILLLQLGRVDAIIAFIIIGREIIISAFREWMSTIGEQQTASVSFLGKLKTTAQLIAVSMLLYHEPLGPLPIAAIGEWLLIIAAILTLWSMGYYLYRARSHI